MDHSEPPPFQHPRETLSTSVQSLIQDQSKLFIEHGVQFCKYIAVKPLDNIELVSSSKLLNFYFKDQNVFINSKRTFLEIQFECQKHDGTALTQADMVSANNVLPQSLIDSCVLNIGNSNFK